MNKRTTFFISFLLFCLLATTSAYGQGVVKRQQQSATGKKGSGSKPPVTQLKEFVTDTFHLYVIGPNEVAITPAKDHYISGHYHIPIAGHLTFPASVTYKGKKYRVVKIGRYALCNDKNITSVTIPYGVKTIGEWAFEDCENLTSISIPNSVTSIEESAFRSCINLPSVVIPNSVKTIGKSAFSACYKLGILTLPNTDIDIDISAFSFAGLSKPTYTSKMFIGLPNDYQGSYSIPDGITTIAEGAFSHCEKLVSITIPSSVNTIGNFAFSNCKRLSSIELPYGIKKIGLNAFSTCWDLISVKIPGSVTYIDDGAFKYSGLKSIYIPDNVTQIDKHAFYKCQSLTQVSIPYALIEQMGEGVFGECSNLKNVTVRYPDGREEKMPLREIWTKKI